VCDNLGVSEGRKGKGRGGVLTTGQAPNLRGVKGRCPQMLFPLPAKISNKHHFNS